MNTQVQNLKGSPKRDVFKWAHKNGAMKGLPFYASDCDLCIVSFDPPGVIAYFDYKGSGESVTSTEKILYDEWSQTKPVYIIEGVDPEHGPFTVMRYIVGGELSKPVCWLKDWEDFARWEASLRQDFRTEAEKDALERKADANLTSDEITYERRL